MTISKIFYLKFRKNYAMQESWTDTNTQMELALFDRPFGEGEELESTWWEELTKKVGKREA